MRFTPVLAVVLLLHVLAAGCADIPASNPFDPSTPSAQQAPARLTGALLTPPGYAPAVYSEASIELRSASDPTQVAAHAAVDRASGTPEGVQRGTFELPAVAAGIYLLHVHVVGLALAPQTVELPVGGTVDLGELTLNAASGATIEGTATRADHPADGQAGILVVAVGTPFAVLTSASGAFRMDVAPGLYTLQASFTGYGTEKAPEFEVGAGEVHTLAAPLALVGLPGSVRGRIVLPAPYDTVENHRNATVRLVPVEGSAAPGLDTNPDEAGLFEIAPVPAGTYTLQVVLTSFVSVARPVVVAVDQRVDLGDVLLQPALFGAVEGTAQLAGAQRSGGIRVTARDAEGMAFTDDTGHFRLDVVAGARDLVFEHDGYGAEVLTGIDVPPNAVTTLDTPVVLSGSPGQVRGRVRFPPPHDTAENRRTSQVSLLSEAGGAADHQATPGDDGAFTLDGVGAGTWHLVATREGFAPLEPRSVEVGPGAIVDVGDVLLFPASFGRIEGVAHLVGAPDDGGIRVEAAQAGAVTFTDRNGAFGLDVLTGLRTLTFTAPGYGLVTSPEVDVRPNETTTLPAEILLAGLPGSIEGTVTVPPDVPAQDLLPNVDLRLLLEADASEVQRPPVGLDGGFLIDGVAAGRYHLTFTLAGFAPETLLVVVEHDRRTVLPPVVLSPLPADAVLRGTAHLLGAAEHGGIRVELAAQPHTTETNAQGIFELPLAAAGAEASGTLLFHHDGYGDTTLDFRTPVPADRVIDLAQVAELVGEPAQIRGVVLLDARVQADQMANVRVNLTRLVGNTVESLGDAAPGADGGFVFNNLGAGTHYAVARLEGMISGPQRAELAVGEHRSLDPIELSLDVQSQGGTIYGRAHLEGHAAGQDGGIRVEDTVRGFVTLTNGEGQYELPVVAGTYDLRFAYAGFRDDRVGPITVTPQRRVAAPRDGLLNAEPGRVRGTVTLPATLADVAILTSVGVRLLRVGDGTEVATGNPDASGSFLFSSVPPGLYTLLVERAGLVTRGLPVEIQPGETVDLHQIGLILEDVPEIPNPVVRGVVQLAGRGPNEHGGVLVEVPLTGFVTVTHADGGFELSMIPGQFRLQFSHDRYQRSEAGPFTLAAGDVVTLPDSLVLAGEPGRIRGSVRLPDGFAAERMAQVTVTLSRAGRVEGSVAPQAEGTFVFPAVASGELVVSVAYPGLVGFQRTVELEIAGTTDTGVLTLALPPELTSAVEGTARLQGVVDPAGHGGIRVEAVGTPFTTITASNGRFRVAVTPGLQTLSFQRDGYGTLTVVQDVVAADVPTPLPAVVVLPAQPGTVRGSVSLAHFGTTQRVQAATVEVLDPQGARLTQAQPTADGRFTLANLAAGPVTLRVTATGYERMTRAVEVPVGGLVEAGDFALVHKSEGPSAVRFSGTLLAGVGADHSGTLVRVRTTNPDQAFTQTITDADGRFDVAAAPDETYRLAVHRNGFVDPLLDSPWHWDAVDRRFEDDAGAPFTLTLQRSPLNGRVEVPVLISPSWIPQEQQFVAVRLRGATYDQAVPQVTEANGAVFTNVPAGNYNVLVERPGFGSVQIPIVLDHEHPTVVFDPVEVTLESLAAAQIDLSGRELAACALRQAPVSFVGADLTGVRLTGDFSAAGGPSCPACVLCGAFDLGGVDLTNADLAGATSFAGVSFVGADLFGADLFGRNLRGADLTATNLFGAGLEGVQLERAVLHGANLGSARLQGAQFSDAAELAAMVAAGSPPCPGAGPVRPRPTVDLTDASFNGSNLTGATLSGVNLGGAVLQGTSLRDAHFERACLSQAVLTLNDLSGAYLDGADATQAQLPGAVLSGTTLRGTQLGGATMTGAIVELADFRPRPTPAGQACDPYPWNTYDAQCVGDAHFTDARCCRTEMDGVNLNGASLVGAALDGVDLTGASLLGVTVGEADEQPTSQPVDCNPETYNDCKDACTILQTCLAGQPTAPDDCSIWTDDCLLGIYAFGDYVRRMDLASDSNPVRCAVNVYATERCPGIQNGHIDTCERGELTPPQRVPPCTWPQILDPAAHGACAPDRIPNECVTRATTFSGARLDTTQLTALTLARAHLNGAHIHNAAARGATIVGAYLQGADFTGTDFGQSDLTAVGFGEVDLTDVNFTQANLQRASFNDALLTGTSFLRADLTRADFSRARAVERPGVDQLVFRQAVLRSSNFTEADLPGAIFRDTILDDVTFDHTHVVGADFTAAAVPSPDTIYCSDLSQGNFTRAIFTEGAFQAVVAEDALFENTNLTGRSITVSDLDRARFVQADLTRVNIAAPCVRDFSPLAGEFCGDPLVYDAECTSMRDTYFDNSTWDDAIVAADLRGAVFRGSPFLKYTGGTLSRSLVQQTGWYASGIRSEAANAVDTYPATDLDLTGACFIRATFRKADMSRAILRDVTTGVAGNAVCDHTCIYPSGLNDDSCRFTRNECIAGHFACATFDRVNLTGSVVDNAYLPRVEFASDVLNGVALTNSNLSASVWTGSGSMTGATFTGCTLDDAQFTGAPTVGATFIRSSMQRAAFTGTALGVAPIVGTSMAGVQFRGVDLSAAVFRDTCAANTAFVSDAGRATNLTGAQFYVLAAGNIDHRADLAGATFIGATLANANLRKAWLPGATFDAAAASGANLKEANLSGAIFRNGTSLVGADLRACNFQAASYANTDFTNATMCQADYTWLTTAGRCPGCTLANIVRDPCNAPALVCGADPCVP